jgi:hypothetical protein
MNFLHTDFFVIFSKHLDLQLFIFRAMFCVPLVLKVISFDRAAVLICSVAIFVDFFEFLK